MKYCLIYQILTNSILKYWIPAFFMSKIRNYCNIAYTNQWWSEVQKQWSNELLWTLMFDKKVYLSRIRHLPGPQLIISSSMKNSWTFSRILGKWQTKKKNTIHNNMTAKLISEALCLFFFLTRSCVIWNIKNLKSY